MRRHDLDQASQHGAAVDAEVEREHHLHREQLPERRLMREPGQRRVGGDERQARDRQQHRLAANPVGQRAADRIPDEIRHRDEQGHQQGPGRRQVQLLAEAGRIHRDEIERRGGQNRDHHAEDDDAPVLDRRCEHFARRRVLLHGEEGRGFLERAPQREDHGNDEAADEERDAPLGNAAERVQEGVARYYLTQHVSNDRSDEDCDLLAGRLKRGVEAPVAGRRDFGEIDGDAAQFDAGGKALDQPSDQHDDRCGNPDGCVGRAERDHHRAQRHQRQRHDQALTAADAVDVGAEHDGAHRAHQRAEPEHAIGIEQRRGIVLGGKERLCDVLRIEAEQEEVELLEEIAAGRAQDRAEP